MNSFLSWVGGKNYLKKEIVKRFPAKFEKYIEVFGKTAWVLFYKEQVGYEIYNDLNSDLVNLFKCVKFHLPELKRELSNGLNSRQLFNKMRERINAEFSEKEHMKLTQMLKRIKEKFLLSYNDCEYVRDLYSQFDVEAVERFSNLNSRYENKDRKYRELIIRNY